MTVWHVWPATPPACSSSWIRRWKDVFSRHQRDQVHPWSIPTRSSMQHKDQRSLKIISPETLSIYVLPVLPNWTAKSSKVPYARYVRAQVRQIRRSATLSFSKCRQKRQPRLAPMCREKSPCWNMTVAPGALGFSQSCSSVLKCIHLIILTTCIDRRARWPITDVLSAVMSKESFTRW
jgi:hypothetical protein